jgi:16S rRNA (cytosine967-C5)-methyltransferase
MDRLVAIQGSLAQAAAALVAPHGRLVYATCSFLPSEGEEAVARLLAEHEDFVPVTARDVLGRARSEPHATPDGRYLRTWRFDAAASGADGATATESGPDGFFAAVVRRVDRRSPGG